MTTLEKANAEAVPSLKKIISSKGQAAGNFYAVTGANHEGGIAISMSEKDPNGAKVLTMGKLMKTEVKNGKFARGLVSFNKEQNTLVLQIAAGNLSASNLKKAAKIGFGDDNLKKYLQKAQVDLLNETTTPQEAAFEQDSVEVKGEAFTQAELIAIELTDKEAAELATEQVSLSDLNNRLRVFLSQEDDELALQGIIATAINEIHRLNEANATTEQKHHCLQSISSIVEYETTESLDKISAGMLILLEEATKINEILPASVQQNPVQMALIAKTKTSFLQRLKEVGTDYFRSEITKFNSYPKSADAPQIDISRANAEESVYQSITDVLYSRHLPNAKTMTDHSWAPSFLQVAESLDATKMIEMYHPSLMNELRQKWNDLPLNCRKVHIEECQSSWTSIKAKFVKTPYLMERFLDYRKKTVDDELRSLRGKHKSGGKEVLLAKSVGSQNLTSDYDLTLTSIDGSGVEIAAIREFNGNIKSIYGKQPGTVFDTNLYAKDFLRVKDTILTNRNEEDDDLAAVEIFSTLDTEDQDIAALTKMCQYMGKEVWSAYIRSTVAKVKDPSKQNDVEKQMREAANLLTIKRIEILKRLSLNQDAQDNNDAEMWKDIVSRLQTKKDSSASEAQDSIDECLDNCSYLLDYLDKQNILKEKINLLKEDPSTTEGALLTAQIELGQLTRFYSNLMEDVLAELEHFFEDEILEVRNDIYMDKMESIRKVQNKHIQLDTLNGSTLDVEAIIAVLSDRDAKKFRACASLTDQKDWLRLKADALKEQAKRMLGEANFFAAEAYLSEGPLQHIVFGNQSGNLEAMERLKPEHFLESVNEQTGDFMKDIKHHGHDSGEAFIQTAKYLSRMFEGIVKLQGKMTHISTATFTDIPKNVGWRDANAMKAEIENELMPIRGAKGQYGTMTDEEKNAAGREIGARIYGTDSVNDLVSKVMSMSATLNAMVREVIDMRSDQAGLKYQETV